MKEIDILYVLDIYAAGEKPIKKISSQNLVKKIKIKNKNVFYLNNKVNLNSTLKRYYNSDNTIIFMGAGSITTMAHTLISR